MFLILFHYWQHTRWRRMSREPQISPKRSCKTFAFEWRCYRTNSNRPSLTSIGELYRQQKIHDGLVQFMNICLTYTLYVPVFYGMERRSCFFYSYCDFRIVLLCTPSCNTIICIFIDSRGVISVESQNVIMRIFPSCHSQFS